MAKKKTAPKTPPETPAVPTAIADLAADGRNPRKISDEGAAGLAQSIEKFGDLAGITFNVRTGELVTGHQRVNQIRAKYGEREIEIIDAAAGIGVIRIDESHVFPVRVVDWSPAKQRAANVAANNPKIQGKFTDDLSAYLLEVEAELAAELPGALDALLLVDLMAAGLDTSDATEKPEQETAAEEAEEEDPPPADYTMRFQVIIECASEEEQVALLDRLEEEGLKCRALIS